MNGVTYICAMCDGVMYENLVHSCVRGLTESIRRMQHDLTVLIKENQCGCKNRKHGKTTVKTAKKNAKVSSKITQPSKAQRGV